MSNGQRSGKEWRSRVLEAALGHEPFTDRELLEMFADAVNWQPPTQHTHAWIWRGPVSPPWEIAMRHLSRCTYCHDRGGMWSSKHGTDLTCKVCGKTAKAPEVEEA